MTQCSSHRECQHPVYKSPSFFNILPNRLDPLDNEGDQLAEHGNGSFLQFPPLLVSATKEKDDRLPEKWAALTTEVISKVQSHVSWEAGDVLLLDNIAVQHARKPWERPRKLLATLWDASDSKSKEGTL